MKTIAEVTLYLTCFLIVGVAASTVVMFFGYLLKLAKVTCQ